MCPRISRIRSGEDWLGNRMEMSKDRNSFMGCDAESSRSHSPIRSRPMFPNESLKESFLSDGGIPILTEPGRLEPKFD